MVMLDFALVPHCCRMFPALVSDYSTPLKIGPPIFCSALLFRTGTSVETTVPHRCNTPRTGSALVRARAWTFGTLWDTLQAKRAPNEL